MDVTDLAWVVLAGGTVCNTSRAAVKVFKDDLFSLDDQLTNTACRVAISVKDMAVLHTKKPFSPSYIFCDGVNQSDVLPTKPVLMPAVLARTV